MEQKRHIHPFVEGFISYEDGQIEYDNPYQVYTWEHNAWLHGWHEAEEHSPERTVE